jgi:MFS family permease
MALVMRFIQGIGNALVQTACYAIVTFVYSDNREKYLGYAEAVTGIGLMLGPVMGGPLYENLGYFESFCCFGGILLLSMTVALIITPSALNDSVGDESQGETSHNGPQDIPKEVSFKMFLTNRRAMFAFMSCLIVCFFMSYQSAFLTDVLRKEKGVPEAWNGAILALPCLTYTISCILVNLLVGKLPRRLLILVSFLLLAGSMILQGPSKLFGITNTGLAIVLVGFALNGVAQGFIFIPLLPDALEAVFIKEKIVEGENDQLDQIISDYGSGLYGTFFSTGQILAPIVGSAIYEAIGYRDTTDFMMVLCFGYSVIFFIFNVGFRIFSDERKIHLWLEQSRADKIQQTTTTPTEIGDIRLVEHDDLSELKRSTNRKTANLGQSAIEGAESQLKNESMMDFLQRKRLQWGSELNGNGGNRINNLSSVFESKHESGGLNSQLIPSL